jgi:ribose/xylose/arabinose/galactoside ABC-type transport system permease subunit
MKEQPAEMSSTSVLDNPSNPIRKIRSFRLPVETGALTALLLISGWLAIRFPDFRTPANMDVILSSGAEIAIVAAGMTLVIATGGIDISVGSVTGLCGIVLGLLGIRAGWSMPMACFAAIVCGALCGLLNGILIAYFRLPPIIATLASFSAARAGAYMLSHGDSMSGLPDSFTAMGLNNWLGIPIAAWIAVLVLSLAGVLLYLTTFGRSLLAIGGNREAAYLSGIHVQRSELLVYVLSGLCAGIASIIVTSRSATAIPDAGKFFEMSAITAVVMGGTPVIGGSATIFGTALGILTIGVVTNGVRTYGKDDVWVQLALGITLLLSVEVDRWRRKRLGLK